MSLSWALGASTNNETNAYAQVHSSHALVDDQLCLKQTATIVNNLIREEVKQSTKTKPIIEQHPRGLDIDNCISEVNPLLWQFIEECTMSSRDRQYHQQSDHLKHVKKLRRFFIICLLQFCCNTEQPLAIC